MKIIPAVLAETKDELVTLLKKAEGFCDYVQIDAMDRDFVPSRSCQPEELNGISTALSYEIHLMVRNPESYMYGIKNTPGLKKVYFHYETAVDHLAFIEKMRERGLAAGLAVKPDTSFDKFRAAAEHSRSVLFLTVDPGRYGSAFRPEVLDKIAICRRELPGIEISVDGGVSLENLHLFYDLGVNSVCVGSRIFVKGNPAENYKLFIRKLQELEGMKVS